MKRFVAVAAFLAVCATPIAAQEEFTFKTSTLWDQDEELTGYVQPEACRRDLSADQTPVFYVTNRELEQLFNKARLQSAGHSAGVYIWPPGPAGVRPGIYVNMDMPERVQQVTLHHERCHVVAGWKHDALPPKR